MTRRWIAGFVVLIGAAGVAAAHGWRWPTAIAAIVALGLAALLSGPLPARAGLLAVAAAIGTEVSAWQGLPPPGTDLAALIMDPARHREQLIRDVVVAGLLVAACLLFARVVLRAGVQPEVVAALVVGSVLLGTRTWLAVDSAFRTLTTPPPRPGGDKVAVAVAVADGPDYLGGLIIVAALAGAVLLSHVCTRLSRRAPA